jgi:hypothetical protein
MTLWEGKSIIVIPLLEVGLDIGCSSPLFFVLLLSFAQWRTHTCVSTAQQNRNHTHTHPCGIAAPSFFTPTNARHFPCPRQDSSPRARAFPRILPEHDRLAGPYLAVHLLRSTKGVSHTFYLNICKCRKKINLNLFLGTVGSCVTGGGRNRQRLDLFQKKHGLDFFFSSYRGFGNKIGIWKAAFVPKPNHLSKHSHFRLLVGSAVPPLPVLRGLSRHSQS